jgi:hypothetical protein
MYHCVFPSCPGIKVESGTLKEKEWTPESHEMVLEFLYGMCDESSDLKQDERITNERNFEEELASILESDMVWEY